MAACRICGSPFREEIEAKDAAWKADRTIRWAREKGVRINRVMLARHRSEHIGNSADKSYDPGVIELARHEAGKQSSHPVTGTKAVDDLEFLDAVKDRVYIKLLAGEIDLKIDSAFKAIEIKNKISDESRNEKLLLEILSEIRADELARGTNRAIVEKT